MLLTTRLSSLTSSHLVSCSVVVSSSSSSRFLYTLVSIFAFFFLFSLSTPSLLQRPELEHSRVSTVNFFVVSWRKSGVAESRERRREQ